MQSDGNQQKWTWGVGFKIQKSSKVKLGKTRVMVHVSKITHSWLKK
jgi:hypothetical protein